MVYEPTIPMFERVKTVHASDRAATIIGEGRRGIHIGYWWESQMEGDHWKDQDVGGWSIIKWILER
jgi:hypothetical protein